MFPWLSRLCHHGVWREECETLTLKLDFREAGVVGEAARRICVCVYVCTEDSSVLGCHYGAERYLGVFISRVVDGGVGQQLWGGGEVITLLKVTLRLPLSGFFLAPVVFLSAPFSSAPFASSFFF